MNTGGGSDTIKGESSGAEYVLSTSTTTTIIVPQDSTQSVTGTADVAGDNESIEFEIDSDGIFDFTDIDPFSEGKYS